MAVKKNKEIMEHESGIEKAIDDMPDDVTLFQLANLFKIFGDGTRIKILFVLFESDMCVYHIAQTLGMTMSAISHQLSVLKNANLVASRRDGKTVYYYLKDDHVRSIIEQGMNHINE